MRHIPFKKPDQQPYKMPPCFRGFYDDFHGYKVGHNGSPCWTVVNPSQVPFYVGCPFHPNEPQIYIGICLTTQSAWGGSTITGLIWKDFIAELDVILKNNDGVNPTHPNDAVCFHWENTNESDSPLNSGIMLYYKRNGDLELRKPATGTTYWTVATGIVPTAWRRLRVAHIGNTLKVWINEQLFKSETRSYTQGYMGLNPYANAGCHCHYDNVKIVDMR